mgnify:CR=1 FL=1
MATQRQIDAYRKRLANIEAKGIIALTAECVGAVVVVREWAPLGEPPMVGSPTMGTLVGYTVRVSNGLLGPSVAVDVTVCTDCVGKRGTCGDVYERTLRDVLLLAIRRNEGGVRESLAPTMEAP